MTNLDDMLAISSLGVFVESVTPVLCDKTLEGTIGIVNLAGTLERVDLEGAIEVVNVAGELEATELEGAVSKPDLDGEIDCD
jgi:hypothetical protein